jgi:hypothetical protein
MNSSKMPTRNALELNGNSSSKCKENSTGFECYWYRQTTPGTTRPNPASR